jgi:hypothetical protein
MTKMKTKILIGDVVAIGSKHLGSFLNPKIVGIH